MNRRRSGVARRRHSRFGTRRLPSLGIFAQAAGDAGQAGGAGPAASRPGVYLRTQPDMVEVDCLALKVLVQTSVQLRSLLGRQFAVAQIASSSGQSSAGTSECSLIGRAPAPLGCTPTTPFARAAANDGRWPASGQAGRRPG